MKKIVLLIICILVSLVSCKPTPEKPIVVSKNDGELERIIHEETAPEGKYIALESWTEEIPSATEDKAKITVDAKITVPNVTKYPVYYVSPDGELSQEYADMLMNYFIGDANLVDGATPELTKNEILKQIASIEKELNDPDSVFNTEDKQLFSEEEFESAKQAKIDYIKELEAAFAKAPTTVEQKPVSRTLTPYTDDNGNIISYMIFGKTEDGSSIVHITKDTSVPNFSRGVIITDIEKGGSLRTSVYSDTDIKEYGMKNYTEKTAKELADKTLSDLGKRNYDAQFIASCNVYMQKAIAENKAENAYRGYIFYYTQVIDNIPVLLEFDSMKANEYQRTWNREYLSVIVSNSGVCSYNENSSMKIGDKINENVPLLDFEKIQAIFRKYISMKISCFDSDRDAKSREVTISDIRLGYLRVAEKNRTDRAYLLPVWMFYGNEYMILPENHEAVNVTLDENGGYSPQNNVGHSYLCINAIDGSIIDLTQGY